MVNIDKVILKIKSGQSFLGHSAFALTQSKRIVRLDVIAI